MAKIFSFRFFLIDANALRYAQPRLHLQADLELL